MGDRKAGLLPLDKRQILFNLEVRARIRVTDVVQLVEHRAELSQQEIDRTGRQASTVTETLVTWSLMDSGYAGGGSVLIMNLIMSSAVHDCRPLSKAVFWRW